ncbi:MAG: hypothetical protein R3C11_10035 [Planctomycetaceae bacterium]
MLDQYQCEVEDTYAEAFRSLYAEFLITARDRKWLNHALQAATGHASSTIMCDCEAGLDRYVGPGGDESFSTPDGRPGAIVQLHVPRFRKDRVPALEKALLARVCQNVLTCPTTACFNMLETEDYYRLGRKLAYFGDGHEFLEERFGRKMWIVPTMGGEFAIDRRFGYADGIMGATSGLWEPRKTPPLLPLKKQSLQSSKRPVQSPPSPVGSQPTHRKRVANIPSCLPARLRNTVPRSKRNSENNPWSRIELRPFRKLLSMDATSMSSPKRPGMRFRPATTRPVS